MINPIKNPSRLILPPHLNIVCRNYDGISCRKSRYHQMQQIAKLGGAIQAHKFATD
jgi:hypothetical protein